VDLNPNPNPNPNPNTKAIASSPTGTRTNCDCFVSVSGLSAGRSTDKLIKQDWGGGIGWGLRVDAAPPVKTFPCPSPADICEGGDKGVRSGSGNALRWIS